MQPASSQPLSENDFISQFSKIKDSIFEITDIQIDTNGVFAPKSLLNKIRREAFCALQEYLIYLNEEKQNILFLPEEYQKQKTQNISISPQNLIITDEFQPNLNSDIIQILSPNEYNKNNLIKNFENIIQKNYALMLPVINNFEDKKIINDIILSLPNNIPLFVNNISGLYYKIFNNKEVIVSPLLNIKNKFSILALNELKVNKICASVESSQEFATKNNLTFFESGNFPIMTFAHCPYKAVHENNCNMCKFNNNLRYQSQSQQEYKISRIKISNCQFYLMKNLSCKKPKYSLKNLKVI